MSSEPQFNEILNWLFIWCSYFFTFSLSNFILSYNIEMIMVESPSILVCPRKLQFMFIVLVLVFRVSSTLSKGSWFVQLNLCGHSFPNQPLFFSLTLDPIKRLKGPWNSVHPNLNPSCFPKTYTCEMLFMLTVSPIYQTKFLRSFFRISPSKWFVNFYQLPIDSYLTLSPTAWSSFPLT